MKDNPKRFAIIVPMAATLLLAALPNAAFSQIAGAGTVTGTLTDAGGAVVPEAQLVVHNEDTGVDRQVSTNAAGIYVAAFLQPGHYEVSATKDGFIKVVRKGLTLQVGQTLTIDLGLSLQTTSGRNRSRAGGGCREDRGLARSRREPRRQPPARRPPLGQLCFIDSRCHDGR